MFAVQAQAEVAAFAEAMQDRLDEFDCEEAWSDKDVYTLFDRIENNLNELYDDVYRATHHASDAQLDVMETCADIANYVMMIANNLGALDEYKDEFPPECEIDPFEGIYDSGDYEDVDPSDAVFDDEPPAEVEL